MVRTDQIHHHIHAINSRRFSLLASQLLLISSMIFFALPALAQTNQQNPDTARKIADNKKTTVLKTVTVRSRNHTEEIQQTPVSISTVSGTELQRFETNNFQGILKKIGNVRWAGASSQNHPLHTSLTIRGLGYFKAGAGGLDPGVSVKVDGVSYAYSTLAAGASFYDLENVDVARGPQGATGGLNANLGVISFTSKTPRFTPEAEGGVTFGQRDTLITKAVLGGAVIDELLAWRGTFYRETVDGAFTNAYNKTQSFGNKDRTSAKVQFLLTPSDDLRIRTSLDYIPKGSELDGGTSFGLIPRETPAFYDTLNSLGNPIAVDRTTTPEGRLDRPWFKQDEANNYLGSPDQVNISGTYPIKNRQRGALVDVDWKIAGGTFSSLTAWRDLFFYWDGKGTDDRTIFDVVATPTAADQTQEQFSQEFKFAAKLDSVSYETGVYYLDKSIHSDSMNRTGSDAGAYFATDAYYRTLDADTSGRLLLTNSANRLLIRNPLVIDGESIALYGNSTWQITDPFSIAAGLRISKEKRHQTKTSRYIADNGYGAELNPAAVNDVQLNGFISDSKGVLANTNSTSQLALANSVANKYFGVPSYSLLTEKQRTQVAAAKAIRLARLGALHMETDAEPYEDDLLIGNISPAYDFNDSHTGYFSYQHGEKAGVSQIVGATKFGGKSVPVDTEKTDAYELGLKSQFFNGMVSSNVAVFYQDIKNFIQPVYFYDAAQTIANNNGLLAYTEGLGNVPKVRSKGVELDLAYTDSFNTVRFAGAYTDARYIEFTNLGKPPELGGSSVAYYDVSGRTVPGASKFTFNIFAEHSQLVFTNRHFHISANYNYTSSYLSEPTLSRYAKVDGYGLTDIVLGISTTDKKFDVSLIAKNLFDVDYGSLFNWNSYAPGDPRWIGVSINAKL
ncbi:TonB-dependent receptor [Cellvibrio mixtus]|uniref:TonB-dependent receptor n=1 Tax=Cellvibrio mixtus TaxID=39650 RepID=UPI000694558A|nr:TonB-dependent receptor [Cellvibrio mixtus]